MAGGVAGLTTVLALHPFDVVKTRLQVQDGAAGNRLPAYQGTRHAIATMISTEGVRGMYGGLVPALAGSGIAWGLYFGCYETLKGWHKQALGVPARDHLAPPLHALCAAESGILVALVTNPLWVVKTRLQLQPGGGYGVVAGAAAAAAGGGAGAARGAVPYKGFLDGLVGILRTEGPGGLYRGIWPSLLLVSHGALQIMAYEEIKKRLSPAGGAGGGTGREGSWLGHDARSAAAGALSKLFASAATYPSQVVRSRLQQRPGGAPGAVRYTGGWMTFRCTLRREGVRGLYKGMVPNLLNVMPRSAMTFLVYEKALRALNSLPG